MSNSKAPVRAMELGGYDQGYNGGSGTHNTQMKTGGRSGLGHFDNEGFGGNSESTAYSNSNYRKPFNPNNMQQHNTISQTTGGGAYNNRN